MSDNLQTDARDNALRNVLLIAAAAVALVTMLVARAAALRGARYTTVWWLVLPSAYISGQVLALCCTVALGFTLVLIGFKVPGNYLFSHSVEFALLNTIAGDRPTVPTWGIALYQFVWWRVVVSGLTRHFAISIYDWAIQTIAHNKNVPPRDIRREVSAADPGYARAEAIYLASGHPPLLGAVLVTLAGESKAEYYSDFAGVARSG